VLVLSKRNSRGLQFDIAEAKIYSLKDMSLILKLSEETFNFLAIDYEIKSENIVSPGLLFTLKIEENKENPICKELKLFSLVNPQSNPLILF
jgi:hypothetical protein